MVYFLDFGASGPTRKVEADGYFIEDGWVHFYVEDWGRKKVASWKTSSIHSVRLEDASAD